MNRREVLKGAVAGAGVVAAPAQTKQAPAWKPKLFDAHQTATVETLSELIIPATDTPGAKAARVVEYIDLILNDGPSDRRNAFLTGLAGLDGRAIREHGKPFVGCAEAQQVAILRDMDGSKVPFFNQAKTLTVAGYYTSKIGIEELNKGGRVPSSFGCPHGGKH